MVPGTLCLLYITSLNLNLSRGKEWSEMLSSGHSRAVAVRKSVVTGTRLSQ